MPRSSDARRAIQSSQQLRLTDETLCQSCHRESVNDPFHAAHWEGDATCTSCHLSEIAPINSVEDGEQALSHGALEQPRTLWPPRLAGLALWFWFLVMLPISVWVAPASFRDLYSWPRALILVWNFCLFWSVLAHASQSRRGLGWLLVGWVAAIQAIAERVAVGPGVPDVESAN